MERFIRILVTCVFLACAVFIGYCDEYDDEPSYEPIHSTIPLSSLDIDETFSKNYSVSISGEDVVLNLKKFSKEGSPTVNFSLPINPRQNYEVEYDLEVSNIKCAFITLTMGEYMLFIGEKQYFIIPTNVLNEKDIFKSKNLIAKSPKKWELVNSETPNALIIKFERKGKNITIFANGALLGEINNDRTALTNMPVSINLSGIGKNLSLTIKPIKVDQGNKSEDD